MCAAGVHRKNQELRAGDFTDSCQTTDQNGPFTQIWVNETTRRSCQAIPSTTSRICTLSPPRAQNDNELPASPHHITYLHTLAKLATHL